MSVGLTAASFLAAAFLLEPTAARALVVDNVANLLEAAQYDAPPSRVALTIPLSEPTASPAGDGPPRGPRLADKPRPPTPAAKPVAGSGLDDEGLVRRALRSRMTSLQRCYDRALLRNAATSGELAFAVEVSPDGRVASARVSGDTLGDPELTRCAQLRIRGWRLPKLRDGESVSLTVPVVFVH